MIIPRMRNNNDTSSSSWWNEMVICSQRDWGWLHSNKRLPSIHNINMITYNMYMFSRMIEIEINVCNLLQRTYYLNILIIKHHHHHHSHQLPVNLMLITITLENIQHSILYWSDPRPNNRSQRFSCAGAVRFAGVAQTKICNPRKLFCSALPTQIFWKKKII